MTPSGGFIRDRVTPYENNDEDRSNSSYSGLYSETTFTSIDQDVEKSELDIFGTILKNQKINVDLYFLHGLEHFNLPMIKYSWHSSEQEDILKLPVPDTLLN